MSIWTALRLVWRYGPAVYHLVSEIWELIQHEEAPQQREAFEVDLKQAGTHYVRNGDRRRLVDLRDRLHRHNYGPVGSQERTR